MNIDEVLQIVHQNGIGQNIKCFFSSENKNGKDHMSLINNYKYNKGTVKIYVDRFSFKEHEKNLITFPDCELLIKISNDLRLNVEKKIEVTHKVMVN